MGVHTMTVSPSSPSALPPLSVFLCTIPGRTSISSPTRRTPCRIDPPATPPCKCCTSCPGRLTSKDRMTINRGWEVKSRTGNGILRTKYSHKISILYFNTAEMGKMGASPATVPATNFRICSCCAVAASGLTKSTLFCKIIMCCNRIISTAAKCSEVCGCGHVSLPATSKRAASMTAAPFNMVAIKISCPGQSTKLKWRRKWYSRPPSSKTSAWDDPREVNMAPKGMSVTALPW
mmetsp:Transcript_29714/g.62094  ORF Transcript_29714/g.62094 Transcript_29714/m.62094 type:complete len:234 (-) Transcript_29714:123-824(-)